MYVIEAESLSMTDLHNCNTKLQTNLLNHDVNFDIMFVSNSDIQQFESLTSDIKITQNLDGYTNIKAKVLPSDGDFNLLIYTNIQTCAYFGVDKDVCYNLITHKIPNEDNTYVPKEYLFLLDRSGSMEGQKISDAVSALTESINLLKPDSYFNVVSFGSSYSCMFEKSLMATDENKNRAKLLLRQYRADMGGTEIYECLRSILKTDRMSFECEKIIVFLTDGQIDNLTQVYDLIKLNKEHNVRIFSIGIGNDASRELIKTISDITSGISQMVIDSHDITEVAKSMIENTQKKYYKNISVDVNGLPVEHFGTKRIYPGQVIYAFFTSSVETDKNLTTLTGFDESRQDIVKWSVDATNSVTCINPTLLAKFYANEMIKEGSLSNEKIIELSVRHNIMNNLTSFIMVDTEVVDAPTTAYNPYENAEQTRCAPAASAPISRSDVYACNDEEVDCLEGGMDMFGGGGSTYSLCNYELLDYVKPDGSFEFSNYTMSLVIARTDLVLTKLNSKEIDKFIALNKIDKNIVFNILALLYIKEMTDKTRISGFITNLEVWLKNKSYEIHDIKTQKIITGIRRYVGTPISYHSGGDY
jgi:uncharacterized protein YegL